MELLTLFLVALGLCFDSFAVSVSSGIARTRIAFLPATRIAFSLAFFQGLMPLVGWFIGKKIAVVLHHADHWIAFGLLGLLGLKMIWESLKKTEETVEFNPLDIRILLMMSLATSIDALVVGVSFGTLNVNILLAILIIGAVTFTISMLGILFGKKTGNRFGKKMEILGGLILIGIGVKILIQHLYFS
ncbi:MAG: manganese efflux pump MntP family protein, partial [Bacteroidetes bacterium]|nr:manganese efflux pump MntP family protein [Bacteroidota bacterium]